jgi:hypothetical protein
MTTQPISPSPCARNLPQHFNGCACTASATGTVTGEASVDLTLVEFTPPAPAPDATPRVVGVVAKELQPGQHVLRGGRVQAVAGPPQPIRYSTIAVPLVASDPFEPDEFRIDGRERVSVFLDADDYDREFVLGRDLAEGDLVAEMGRIYTIRQRSERSNGDLVYATDKGDITFTGIRGHSEEFGVTRLTRRATTASGVPIDSAAAKAPFYADKTPGGWFVDPDHDDEFSIVSPDGGYATVFPELDGRPEDTYAVDDRQWVVEGLLPDETHFEQTCDDKAHAQRVAEEILFARRGQVADQVNDQARLGA